MQNNKPFSFLLALGGTLIFANGVNAQNALLETKYFVETKLPTHSDGIQRFEPDNFLNLDNMNALDLIANIITINRLDAKSALIVWNGDFFKNGQELNEEILKRTAASEIKFVEIFDGEGSALDSPPNKIINLISKIYLVEAENYVTLIPKGLENGTNTKPFIGTQKIQSKFEFENNKSEKHPTISTVFDEQGILKLAKIDFGEVNRNELKTTFFGTQFLSGNDFRWEAKFNKKQAKTTQRENNIFGSNTLVDFKGEDNDQSVIAINSILKSHFLGIDTSASLSGSSEFIHQNNDIFDFGGKIGLFENVNATINFNGNDIIFETGADTKSLKEIEISRDGKGQEIRVFQSRTFAKLIRNWELLDGFSVKSEVGGAIYSFDSPFLLDSEANVFAMNSLISAQYEDRNIGKLTAKFEAKPREYHHNQYGFILPISDDADFYKPQNNQNLQITYERAFDPRNQLTVIFENNVIQNRLNSVFLNEADGAGSNQKRQFGDSKHQKFAAKYFVEINTLFDAKLSSGFELETQIEPKAKAGSQTLFEKSKRQNYQIGMEANMPNSENSWGALYAINSIQYSDILNNSTSNSENGNFGIFVNFNYGKIGAIRAELNAPIMNENREQYVDEDGNFYSARDFINPNQPKVRLIFMKKL